MNNCKLCVFLALWQLIQISRVRICERNGTVFAGCTEIKDVGIECAEKSPSIRYNFDSHTGVCQPFQFNGCGGNKNNFETLHDCVKKCETKDNSTKQSSVVDAAATFETKCGLSISYLKNNEPQKCERSNDCKAGFECTSRRCCPTKAYICSQKLDVGHELVNHLYKHTTRFAYNADYNTCNLFTFFGYGGNFNNFPDFESCKKYCSA